MKKIVFVTLLFTVLIAPTQIAVVNAKKPYRNTSNIVCVVIGRERANKDYSVGISLNAPRDKEIDEVHFKMPFKYKPKIGFQTKGWDTTIKGKTVTIRRKETQLSESEKEENEYAMSSINFRLDFGEKLRVKIPPKLKTPIKYNVFSKGKSIFNGKANVHFMPKVKLNNGYNIFLLPGRIPQGGFFSSTINDDIEQLIQNSVIKDTFGDKDIINEEAADKFLQSVKAGGLTVVSESKDKLVSPQKSEFDVALKLNYEPLLEGDDRIQIVLKGKLPNHLKSGDKLKIKHTDRFGEVLVDKKAKNTEITDKVTACRFQLNDSAKYVFPGERLCACGCFPRVFDSSYDRLNFKIDGKFASSFDSSKTAASIYIRRSIAPGEHTLSFRSKSGKMTAVKFNVIKVNGSIDQSKLWTGQSTSLRLQIIGTKNKLPFELSNNTPRVVRLDGGRFQTITSSGGVLNAIMKGVRGIKKGNFDIKYKLNLPFCPCDDLSEDF